MLPWKHKHTNDFLNYIASMNFTFVFHMDVEWFGIYGPVENGLDMDDRPLSGIRKGTILRKMTDSPTFQLSI